MYLDGIAVDGGVVVHELDRVGAALQDLGDILIIHIARHIAQQFLIGLAEFVAVLLEELGQLGGLQCGRDVSVRSSPLCLTEKPVFGAGITVELLA